MAVGVACGTGYIGFAVVFFAILAVVMILIAELNFGGCKKTHMTLKIAIPENLDYQGIFEPVLNKYTAFHKLRRVKTTNFGTLFELIYSVEIDDTIDQKKFIDELRALNGNMTVNLVHTSKGRIILPLTTGIPARPFSAVPRERFRMTVSRLSFAL